MPDLTLLAADWHHALAAALLHSLWIGTLIAVVARFSAKVLFSRSAGGRAACSLTGLFCLGVMLPVLVLASAFMPSDLAPSATARTTPPSVSSTTTEHGVSAFPWAPSASPLAEPALQPSTAARFWRSNDRLAALAAWGYLAGIAVMCVRLVWAYAASRRLRARATWIRDVAVTSLLDDGLERLAIGFRPGLAICTRTAIPVLSGALRPVILLPEPVVASANQEMLGSLILHELAHLKRGDHWGLAIQYFAETVAFYHPAAWLLSRQLDEERELACDQLVLSTGVTPHSYAEALVSCAELSRSHGRQSPVSYAQLGAARPGSLLRRRIHAVLGVESPLQSGGVSVWTAVGVSAVFALSAALVASAAGKAPVAVDHVETVATPAKSHQADLESTPSATLPEARLQIAQAEAEKPKTAPAKPVWFGYVDESADSRRSLGGSGHAVRFDRTGQPGTLQGIRLFGARYGYPKAPDEDIQVAILGEDQSVLTEFAFPYSKFQRGDMKWVYLKTPPTEVPETFYVAVNFSPTQTKGVYLGLDSSVSESHSFTGIAGESLTAYEGNGDWMIRVQLSGATGETPMLEPSIKPEAPAGKTSALDKDAVISVDFDVVDGKQSYGGAGPAVSILTGGLGEQGVKSPPTLTGVRIYASRYGTGYDPAETEFSLQILDKAGSALWEHRFPYGAIAFEPGWVDLILPEPIEVSEWSDDGRLTLGIDPEATQRKGIYFHYSDPTGTQAGARKITFTPPRKSEWGSSARYAPGSSPVELTDRAWLIRPCFARR